MTERRMKLTEEEARHIEQRRLMENRFNLGYNEALAQLCNHIENIPPIASWTDARQHLLTWASEARKPIRP